jgi:hypothetical protein
MGKVLAMNLGLGGRVLLLVAGMLLIAGCVLAITDGLLGLPGIVSTLALAAAEGCWVDYICFSGAQRGDKG